MTSLYLSVLDKTEIFECRSVLLRSMALDPSTGPGK